MLVQNPASITHKELHTLGRAAKGCIDRIYLHWTAGNYGQAYSEYHLNIDQDGQVYQTCQSLLAVKGHTYGRNKRSIGIALCCGAEAVCQRDGRIYFGNQPPTPVQIEKMAQVVAVLAHALGLAISFSTVTTHAEAAFMDGYGPGSGDSDIRWDLWYIPDRPLTTNLRPGGVVLRGKALWYTSYYFQNGHGGFGTGTARQQSLNEAA